MTSASGGETGLEGSSGSAEKEPVEDPGTAAGQPSTDTARSGKPADIRGVRVLYAAFVERTRCKFVAKSQKDAPFTEYALEPQEIDGLVDDALKKTGQAAQQNKPGTVESIRFILQDSDQFPLPVLQCEFKLKASKLDFSSGLGSWLPDLDNLLCAFAYIIEEVCPIGKEPTNRGDLLQKRFDNMVVEFVVRADEAQFQSMASALQKISGMPRSQRAQQFSQESLAPFAALDPQNPGAFYEAVRPYDNELFFAGTAHGLLSLHPNPKYVVEMSYDPRSPVLFAPHLSIVNPWPLRGDCFAAFIAYLSLLDSWGTSTEERLGSAAKAWDPADVKSAEELGKKLEELYFFAQGTNQIGYRHIAQLRSELNRFPDLEEVWIPDPAFYPGFTGSAGPLMDAMLTAVDSGNKKQKETIDTTTNLIKSIYDLKLQKENIQTQKAMWILTTLIVLLNVVQILVILERRLLLIYSISILSILVVILIITIINIWSPIWNPKISRPSILRRRPRRHGGDTEDGG